MEDGLVQTSFQLLFPTTCNQFDYDFSSIAVSCVVSVKNDPRVAVLPVSNYYTMKVWAIPRSARGEFEIETKIELKIELVDDSLY